MSSDEHTTQPLKIDIYVALNHIAGINPALPISAENFGDRNGLVELVREAGPRTLRALSGVSILGVRHILRVGLVVGPFGPSGGVDHIGHVCLLEDDAGILGPGAACDQWLDNCPERGRR